MRIKIKGIFLFCFLSLFSAPVCFAGNVYFESGPAQVSLVEVFSSEGCSSCPPADAWVSRLKKDPDLWKKFIPVIFHVDYWDRLGWKDPFAAPLFTERQGEYVRLWKQRSLYTPGFVLNGKEWASWARTQSVPSLVRESGNLSVTFRDPFYEVRFEAASKGEWMAHLAVIGFEIQSEVKRGENAGRVLKHDFVVLDFNSIPMKGNPALAEFQPDLKKFQGHKQGLAVWVTQADNPAPVQAAGGYL